MAEVSVALHNRLRLVDEVASILRDRICNGAFSPGERLRQERLSEELGVSRTPLREALRVLESEGFLRLDPHRGARVVAGDLDTLLEAYEVREVVDGLAARLACSTSTLAVTSELATIVLEQERFLDPWDAESYTHSNVAFHAAIIKATQNEFVAAQMPILRMTARVFTPVTLVDRDAAEVAVQQHKEILSAIASQNSLEAERLARAHIRTTIERLRSSTA